MALPGTITAYGQRGQWPAASLTSTRCERACGHCMGLLLHSMHPATTPEALVAVGRRALAAGAKGMLISGGSDMAGRLPWQEFLGAISILASEGLAINAHVGIVELTTARALKAAGVHQALVELVATEAVARDVLRLAGGLKALKQSLVSCMEAGLEVVPHIIVGLGEAPGQEQWAIEWLAELKVQRVVVVGFMPLKHTPMAAAPPPSPWRIAEVLARARIAMPSAFITLGCARPRGRLRAATDYLAVMAGVDAVAIPSEGIHEAAQELGIRPEIFPGCCSAIPFSRKEEENEPGPGNNHP